MRHYGDFPCYTVWPAHATPSPGSTIYLHGGGYVSEIQAEHWNLISDIVCETGKPVHVPIYGLAPEHHAVEAILFIKAVMADASAGGPMYLAGDSAGAGLALSATLDWLADGGIPPCGLTLIGPWLDITLRDPTIRSVSPRDPGSASTPSITSAAIGRTICTPTSPESARSSETSACCHTSTGGIHVYPLLPVPEGRAARTQITAAIAKAL